MPSSTLVNLSSLIDDAKCYELVRQHRWPGGVRCVGCGGRFDDLTGTVLAGHHRPLRVWVLCLYLMGLNLSNRQIARELDVGVSDAQAMTEALRHGLAAKLPPVVVQGEVEIDE